MTTNIKIITHVLVAVSLGICAATSYADTPKRDTPRSLTNTESPAKIAKKELAYERFKQVDNDTQLTQKAKIRLWTLSQYDSAKPSMPQKEWEEEYAKMRQESMQTSPAK